jgi:flavorubredoxin
LFDDKTSDFSYAFRYYFFSIFRPFKEYARKALEKIGRFEIDMIAPSHGPILRTGLRRYVELYNEWSQSKGDPKSLLIFYASAYGNTRSMAHAIAEGAMQAGARPGLFDIVGTEIEHVLEDIESAGGIVVGSLTINGDAVKFIWDLLSSLATVKVKGKIGASFGCYAWSGEAAVLIEERLKGLKFKVIQPALRVPRAVTDEDLSECRRFGMKIAQALQ